MTGRIKRPGTGREASDVDFAFKIEFGPAADFDPFAEDSAP
jgi:hypothetical protein